MTRSAALLLATLFGIVVAQQTSGITINTTYNSGGTGAINPSFDPGAALLTPIFNAAANFYEDVFEDLDHTLTINFWYQDLSGGTIGDHDLVSQSGGRETAANIQIDTNVNTGGSLRSYFYDPTPTNNSEFNMTQTLWRDASGAQRVDWFNFNPFTANIPDT